MGKCVMMEPNVKYVSGAGNAYGDAYVILRDDGKYYMGVTCYITEDVKTEIQVLQEFAEMFERQRGVNKE